MNMLGNSLGFDWNAFGEFLLSRFEGEKIETDNKRDRSKLPADSIGATMLDPQVYAYSGLVGIRMKNKIGLRDLARAVDEYFTLRHFKLDWEVPIFEDVASEEEKFVDSYWVPDGQRLSISVFTRTGMPTDYYVCANPILC